MKVALISPYCSQNHGTVLQAFALSYVLHTKGHKCEFIRWEYYKPTLWGKCIFVLKHPFFIYIRNKFQKKILSNDLDFQFLNSIPYSTIREKNRKFCDVNIPQSKELYYLDTLEDSVKQYDKFIIGSDQTWSPNFLYQYSPYYLSFVKDPSMKLSYACSCGTINLSPRFLRFLQKKLSSFSYLSCREELNSRTISEFLGKGVKCVLDPTLLLDQNCWERYMVPCEGLPKQYILCYILGEKQCISDYAEFLGEKKKLPVFYILTRPFYEHKKNVLNDVCCQKFLWLIRNCTYLVTDSFHGTIFSINFHRNFVSFDKRPGNALDNGRLKEILSNLNLNTHYHKDTDMSLPNEINFDQVDNVLEVKRTLSIEYLSKILNK